MGTCNLLIWARPQTGLDRAKPQGARETSANIWGLKVGRRVLGARPRERAETLSREKVEGPKELPEK